MDSGRRAIKRRGRRKRNTGGVSDAWGRGGSGSGEEGTGARRVWVAGQRAGLGCDVGRLSRPERGAKRAWASGQCGLCGLCRWGKKRWRGLGCLC
jgi:hypothetical protein